MKEFIQPGRRAGLALTQMLHWLLVSDAVPLTEAPALHTDYSTAPSGQELGFSQISMP